ncbi:MAG: electron transport complex subunit E [Gammaproteobacteria bacterium]|nr:MAG: electron transport complex subunit E [Gammaproteobacteria bacterium]
MSATPYGKIVHDGLWANNPAFVQILGLCPLLAVSNSVINALGLGLATLLTLTLSNTIVSLIRNLVTPEIRLPVFVLVIASVVTAIELAMNAYLHELHTILGIFIPLIVTNCIIIARAEAFASKNTVARAATDGFMMGLGSALALVLLGALRESLGHGTLLANAHLVFGEAAKDWTITLVEHYHGFLLAILPPGAFIGLGLLIAVKNVVDSHIERRSAQAVPLPHEAGATA